MDLMQIVIFILGVLIVMKLIKASMGVIKLVVLAGISVIIVKVLMGI